MSELGRQQQQQSESAKTVLALTEEIVTQKKKKSKSHNKKCEHDRFMQNSCDRCGREDGQVIAKRRKDEKIKKEMDKLKRFNDERMEKLKRKIAYLECELDSTQKSLVDREQTIQHLENELKNKQDEIEEMVSTERASQRVYGETIEKARQYEDMLKKIRLELMRLEVENEYLKHQLKTRQDEGISESLKESIVVDDEPSKKEEEKNEENVSDADSPSSNDEVYLCIHCKREGRGGIKWPRQEEIDRRRQIKMYDYDDDDNEKEEVCANAKSEHK